MTDDPSEDRETTHTGKGSHDRESDGGTPATAYQSEYADRDGDVDGIQAELQPDDGWTDPPETVDEIEKGTQVRVDDGDEVVEGEVAIVTGSSLQVDPGEGSWVKVSDTDAVVAVEDDTPDTSATEASFELSDLSSDAWNDLPPAEETRMRSRRDVATSILHPGAVDERLQTGEMSPRVTEAQDNGWENRVGGWSELDVDEINGAEGLLSKDDVSAGRTALSMEVGTVETDKGTQEVFITNHGDDVPHGEEQAQREMAGWAFQREMGLRTTPHTMDTENKLTASRGVEGHDVPHAPDEWIAKVSDDVAVDYFAGQLLGGNWDAKPENVVVNESGELTWIDNDSACHDLQDGRFDVSDARDRLDDALPALDVDATPDDVLLRATEMATELVEQGEVERIHDAVATYSEEHADTVERNIRWLADTQDTSS